MRQAFWLMSVFTLAIAMSCLAQAQEKKEKEDDDKEVTVKFEDLPAAVQTTFKEEAGGATITEVEKETEDGKTVYEADVQIKGKTYEIEVAEDGTLLEKVLADHDDDDGDDKEDDDKEEKKDAQAKQ